MFPKLDGFTFYVNICLDEGGLLKENFTTNETKFVLFRYFFWSFWILLVCRRRTVAILRLQKSPVAYPFGYFYFVFWMYDSAN